MDTDAEKTCKDNNTSTEHVSRDESSVVDCVMVSVHGTHAKDGAKTGQWLPHAVNCVRSVFGAVTFLFVHEISREPLNGFVPNSQRRHTWSLACTSLNIKVKGQGNNGQKTGFSADISGREPLKGFATNSHETRDWSLDPRSDEFEGRGQRSKVKGQGHRDKNGIFGPFRGLCPVYVW